VLPPLGASFAFRLVGQLLSTALLAIAVWGVATGAGVGRTLAVLVVLALVKGVARYLEQFTGHTVAFRALAILRVHFFERLEPQAPAAVDGRRTGDLLARVTRDIDRVEVFFAHTLVPAATAVVTPVAVLVWLAAWAHPLLAAIALVAWLVAGAAVPVWGVRRTAAAAVGLRVARGDVAQHVTDSVQGVREVLAFDATGRRLDELDAASGRVGTALRTGAATVGLRRGVSAFLVPATLLALTWAGAGLVADGTLAWPRLAVALAAVLATYPAVLAVEEFAADLDQAFASARRVFEVTDAPPATSDPATPVTLPPAVPDTPSVGGLGQATRDKVHPPAPSGAPLPAPAASDASSAAEPGPAGRGGRTVTFEHVAFAYPGPPRTPALDGVDLVVPAGTTTALVGASGAGKSTLVHLLLRYWDPDAGTIRLDGVDVRDLALADLRAQVSLVPQRPHLFAGTLADNLRLARPDATDADLDAACALARLDDLVARLPAGYGTPVGEMGSRLSGGQRQRLAIARAVLQDAPVLVLDEATSQLDTATQASLLAALRDLSAGRTVIQVAHRLETVRAADQIAVLDAGRVVERGTHDELAAAGGAYAALLARAAGSSPDESPTS
jgi:ABC-type multidrug transport system fused ATPase/permease subunit